MTTITNPKDAKAAARELVERDKAQIQQLSSAVTEWVNEVEKANIDDPIFGTISALLSLSDEDFNLLGPVFLEEIMKSFNDINNELLLVHTYNARGITQEDIQRSFEELSQAVDSMTSVSAPKRDFIKQLLAAYTNATADIDGIAKTIINIPIELCHPDAKMPTYANPGDAGLDIYAIEDVTISPGETVLMRTGIKVAVPLGYELQVRPKSGRALRTKLRVANAPGTCDAGYRQEVGVILENIEPFIRRAVPTEDGRLLGIEYGESYTIHKGEKFAQLVLNAVPKVAWTQVESIDQVAGDRGGGFGSSGLR